MTTSDLTKEAEKQEAQLGVPEEGGEEESPLGADDDSEILGTLEKVRSEEQAIAALGTEAFVDSKTWRLPGCYRLYGTKGVLQTTITNLSFTLALLSQSSEQMRWILEFNVGTRVRISNLDRRRDWVDILFEAVLRDENGAYMEKLSGEYARKCRGEPEYDTVEGLYSPVETPFYHRVKSIELGGKYNKRVHWCRRSRRSGHVC